MQIPLLAQAPANINIVVVEGEGAINNIRQRVNREPVVRVEDESHKPISGAAVIFFLPTMGPSGEFPDGATTLTTTSDEQGRAAARGIRFNSQPGTMQIRVAASYMGQTASATITQTNVLGTSTSAGTGMSSKTKWLIIGGVIAGGALAGIAAAHGGGGSSSGSPSTTPASTVTLTPGVPTVGAPQ